MRFDDAILVQFVKLRARLGTGLAAALELGDYRNRKSTKAAGSKMTRKLRTHPKRRQREQEAAEAVKLQEQEAAAKQADRDPNPLDLLLAGDYEKQVRDLPQAPTQGESFPGGRIVSRRNTGHRFPVGGFKPPGLTPEEVEELNRRLQQQRNRAAGPAAAAHQKPCSADPAVAGPSPAGC